MAGVMLIPTSGFALHSIKCLMTDQEFHSVGNSSCCCGTPREDESQRCCDEETTTIKADRGAVQKELSSSVHPVFFAAFAVSFLTFEGYPDLEDEHFLHYLKIDPTPPKRDIIVLVQSFLI